MSPSKPTASRGFTLIELMVTLSVFAILAAVAVPNVSGYIVSSRLTSYANDVLAALNLARSEAVRRNQRVIVCPVGASGGVPDTSACVDPGSGNWQGWMVFEDTQPANGTREAGEEVIRAGVFGGGATVVRASDALSGTANRVVFRPDGIAKAHGGITIQQVAIRVCDSSSRRTQNARDINMLFGSRVGVERAADSSCAAPSNPS